MEEERGEEMSWRRLLEVGQESGDDDLSSQNKLMRNQAMDAIEDKVSRD